MMGQWPMIKQMNRNDYEFNDDGTRYDDALYDDESTPLMMGIEYYERTDAFCGVGNRSDEPNWYDRTQMSRWVQ